MKLASLRNSTRDGELVVVRKDLRAFARAKDVAPSLQVALDDWDRTAPRLLERSIHVERGEVTLEPFHTQDVLAPLPRAYEWVDGSAYLNHVALVRRARGAELPQSLETDPLVYQGGSGVLLGARDPIAVADTRWGADFEAELCVILGDTPQGTVAHEAASFIRLFMLANDVSLRNLVPAELEKGFGFFQSKPATAFSPVAVTPDEFGSAFRDGRVYLRLRSVLNGEIVGDVETGPEMHFSFFDLIQHITKTRSFTAGTILGSGTVSNQDRRAGVSCLAERRMIEIVEQGSAKTAFLAYGNRIEIEMLDETGCSIFGRIEQEVVPWTQSTTHFGDRKP